MHRLIRHRPSPAMVVACLALLVALTGTSVAAVTALAPNSVGTAQIRANAVTSAKIKNRNVTGAKIARNAVSGSLVLNGSLTRADFAASSLPAGPAGPAWSRRSCRPRRHDRSDHRAPGRRRRARGRCAQLDVPTRTVSVNCNANEKAISAGTGWSDDADDRELWTQRLTPIVTNNNVTGFRATGGNDSGNSSTFTLYVLCYTG